jgi:hypothetical protein
MDTENQEALVHIAKAHQLVEKNHLLNPLMPSSENWVKETLLGNLAIHLQMLVLSTKWMLKKKR